MGERSFDVSDSGVEHSADSNGDYKKTETLLRQRHLGNCRLPESCRRDGMPSKMERGCHATLTGYKREGMPCNLNRLQERERERERGCQATLTGCRRERERERRTEHQEIGRKRSGRSVGWNAMRGKFRGGGQGLDVERSLYVKAKRLKG